MKRILLVSTLGLTGGVQRMNAWLANHLAERAEVAVYSRGEAKAPAFELKVKRFSDPEDENWGLKFKRLTGQGFLKLDFLNRPIYEQEATKIAQKISEFQADRIILSSNEILFLPALKKKFPQKTFIAWLHSSAERYMIKVFIGLKQDFLQGLKEADTVVCLTQSDADFFSQSNPKTVVIFNPNPVENSELSKLDASVISWVGRLDYKGKGLDYLNAIADNLPENWTVKVAGPGNPDQLKSKKILYQGNLSGDALKQHYLESSIFLMTSRLEGFGLVLVEAMSFGLPVIAFEQSGANAILEGGKYGMLVKQAEVSEMSQKIEGLIQSKALRKNYQEKSLAGIKRFEPNEILAQWEKILNI